MYGVTIKVESVAWRALICLVSFRFPFFLKSILSFCHKNDFILELFFKKDKTKASTKQYPAPKRSTQPINRGIKPPVLQYRSDHPYLPVLCEILVAPKP